jgi:hypothetical protein
VRDRALSDDGWAFGFVALFKAKRTCKPNKLMFINRYVSYLRLLVNSISGVVELKPENDLDRGLGVLAVGKKFARGSGLFVGAVRPSSDFFPCSPCSPTTGAEAETSECGNCEVMVVEEVAGTDAMGAAGVVEG